MRTWTLSLILLVTAFCGMPKAKADDDRDYGRRQQHHDSDYRHHQHRRHHHHDDVVQLRVP